MRQVLMGRSGTITVLAALSVLTISLAALGVAASIDETDPRDEAERPLPDQDEVRRFVDKYGQPSLPDGLPDPDDPGDEPDVPGTDGNGPPSGDDAPRQEPKSPPSGDPEEARRVVLQYVPQTPVDLPAELPTDDEDASGVANGHPSVIGTAIGVIYVSIDHYFLSPGLEAAGTVKQSALNLMTFLRGFACSLLSCGLGEGAARSSAYTAAYEMAAATQVAARDTNLVALAAIAATGTGVASLFPGFRRLLRYGGISLLSRIPAKDIFKSDVRRGIHDIVRVNPGIALNEIVEKLDLSRNAVAYHLAVFEHEHEIVSVKDGKYRRYFQNGGKYTNGAKVVVSALRNDKTLEVARFISDHPGAIQKQVCAAIGTSPSATNWHIQRLEKVGLVTKEREANTVKYFPGQAVEKYDLTEFGLKGDELPAASITAPSMFAAPHL